MTPQENENTKLGCVGLTIVETGRNGMPDMSNCYTTLSEAKVRAQEMKSDCAARGGKPRIFSTRFFHTCLPRRMPRSGKVDMNGVDWSKGRPGYVNFDFGWYDEDSNSWWHANHYDPDPNSSDPRERDDIAKIGEMRAYRSTTQKFNEPLLDFDTQVFGVACGLP